MAPKLHFMASSTEEARGALEALREKYGEAGPDDAEIIVALGGDGFMLQTLHGFLGKGKPVYGMNLGTIGFMMNEFEADGLLNRLEAAESAVLHPLRMRATTKQTSIEALAFNEVSLLRQTRQTAKIKIFVDDKVRLNELICDGVLIATPAGSTAYNLSAHGPILPIDSDLLALTPISAFRPRRWRGALLSHSAQTRFEIQEPEKRPVSAVADNFEVRDIIRVEVAQDRSISITMLFDAGHSLNERILTEQFQN